MGGLKWKLCYKKSRVLASARMPPLICVYTCVCVHVCLCKQMIFVHLCLCTPTMRSFHLRSQVARGAISIISIQSNLPHTDCGTDSDASWQKPCARPIQIIRPWISIWKKYPEPLAADFHKRAILWACQFERHWAGWPRKRGLASVWERSPSTRQRRKNILVLCFWAIPIKF